MNLRRYLPTHSCHIVLIFLCVLGSHSLGISEEQSSDRLLSASPTIWIGDSITYDGHFIAVIEATLPANHAEPLPKFINLGLQSETLCGLSEPSHPFPRPNVHERLCRVLRATTPALVVACYGINDGMYYPFSQERFNKYREGVRRLAAKVASVGADLILMTPPPFDSQPMAKQGKLLPKDAPEFSWSQIYENYDAEVLRPYSHWLKQNPQCAKRVIDLRTPIQDVMEERRRSDPDFVMSKDGIHLDSVGHHYLAEAILDACQISTKKEPSQEVIALVKKRQDILRDAWLTKTGHTRPSVPQGMPLEQAKAKADEIDRELSRMLSE